MIRRFRNLVFTLFLGVCTHVFAGDGDWPRFRGPGGRGIAEQAELPNEFGPNATNPNVLWKTNVPLGHSSPVIWSGKVFLTGRTDDKLETLCLDAARGEILWRVASPLRNGTIPKVRRVNSEASPSAAVNANIVCVYFDAFGLVAYDHDGKELWQKKLPKAKQPWGVGTSPIISDDRVYLNVDQDIDSYLLALEADSGKEIWRTTRPDARRGFSTPVIAGDQIIVAGSLRLVAYDLSDGKEAWTVKGLPYQVSPSPVVVDESVYIAAWDLGYTGLNFDNFLNEYDKDKSGTITAQEYNFMWDFPKFDRNKDKEVTREEFDGLVNVFSESHDSLMSIRLGGTGNVSDSHVRWEVTNSLPHIPSLLVYRGLLYTVKNGGVVCCYDAETGKRHFQKRLPAGGNYYSSPIAAGGNVYFASEKGIVSVIEASTEYKLLSKNEFDDKILATPAVTGNTMLIRSGKTLYAIAQKP